MDTYDITEGVNRAVRAAGTELGGVRIDSGDLGIIARQVRAQLDALGATKTRIVVSGDLDEYAIGALRAEPIDVYGVGTSLVTGSGAPTAGMVYKLVEVDGRPVAKRSTNKPTQGGGKRRRAPPSAPARPSRRVVSQGVTRLRPDDRLQLPLVRGGEPGATCPPWRRPRPSAGRAGLATLGGAGALTRGAGDPDRDWS